MGMSNSYMYRLLIHTTTSILLCLPLCSKSQTQIKLHSISELRNLPYYYSVQNPSIYDNPIELLKVADKQKVHKVVIEFAKIDSLEDTISIKASDYPHIEEINLRNASCIPDEIFDFENLQILKIDFNSSAGCIFNFPYKIYALSNLKILEIKNAPEIFFLSERIGELKQLQYCDIQSKKGIQYLPIGLNRLESLKFFNCTGGINCPAEMKLLLLSHPGLEHNIISESYNIEDIKSPAYHDTLPEKVYYDDHSKAIEGEYKKGKPEGKWKLYYQDGSLKQIRHYKNGLEIGTWIFFDRKGNKSTQFKFLRNNIVVYESYNAEGDRVFAKTFVNGRANGHWLYYKSKSFVKTNYYENDRLIREEVVK